jgi:hypothetical protein
MNIYYSPPLPVVFFMIISINEPKVCLKTLATYMISATALALYQNKNYSNRLITAFAKDTLYLY